MKLRRSLRKLERQIEDAVGTDSHENRIVLRNIGLVSAGVATLAIGLVVGRELRQRYKFNRRTPYDLYEHAGDQTPEMEFGVGV
jgi:hypothetical protein